MTHIELLAPARDLECGKAAIDHGADAVFIGGPAFGARAAAGNSMSDIDQLARYAHRFRAKVYLTLNTMLFDDELEAAREIAFQAWDAGADALVIQDMGLLNLDLPPLPLIASTQMHNVDIDRIRFLEKAGFQRVILARELSLKEIGEIRNATAIELEAFVHGSLCVSYSGRCYLSATLGGRSANRGACGQPCRLPWTLTDAQGRIIEQNRHLLSLKDMDRSASLNELISSGVTAFKIEGRLKDTAYVKNVTAFYRTRIDSILESRTELKRASSGRTEFSFTPDPSKTFCRGATSYFLHGKPDDMWSPDTPKSIGEEIGTVTQCGPNWFSLAGDAGILGAGDGLCFFDRDKELQGMQVVKVLGERIQVHLDLAGLKPGMNVFRNRDHRFLKQLAGETSTRKISLSLFFRETEDGFALEGLDEDGVRACVPLTVAKEPAEKPEAALETLRKQLSRLGESIFSLKSLDLETRPYFLRTAAINALRRDFLAAMEMSRELSYFRTLRSSLPDEENTYPLTELDYTSNVSNREAREFLQKHGVHGIAPAFELQTPPGSAVVMTTKHCLRRCLNACPRREPQTSIQEPLFMENAGRRFRLAFDCRNCCMQLIRE